MLTQTVVFKFENQEQRQATLAPFKEMFMADSGPQVTGLSSGDELARAQLMFDALDRYEDHYDLRQAIADLADAEDVTGWDWDKYDSDSD
jgi:hypothetical protein